MKILFLHSLGDPEKGGGAEQTIWTLMRGLRDAGHKCVLLATSDTPGLRRSEREGITVWQAGIRNIYWPYHKKRPIPLLRLLWHTLDIYNPWMQDFIRQVVSKEQPDLASLHNLPGWSAASWSTLAGLKIPIVQVLHDYYSICIKSTMYNGRDNCTNQCIGCRIFRLPHRTLSRQIQAVVGVSRFILERHHTMGYFVNVPIQRVINNAREPYALGVNDTSQTETHHCIRFGFIGTLTGTKGIEPLVREFLAADLHNAELWIAGSGKKDYEKQLRNAVTDGRVHFKGRVVPREFYPQVDVVVVPSLWNDNLPGVVFESLAFGKPVIGSRRGGIPEMIRDGENGLLFEPKVPGELADCLRRIHDDAALHARLTANAKPSSTPFMDVQGWVRKYEKLYREVISNSNTQQKK